MSEVPLSRKAVSNVLLRHSLLSTLHGALSLSKVLLRHSLCEGADMKAVIHVAKGFFEVLRDATENGLFAIPLWRLFLHTLPPELSLCLTLFWLTNLVNPGAFLL